MIASIINVEDTSKPLYNYNTNILLNILFYYLCNRRYFILLIIDYITAADYH